VCARALVCQCTWRWRTGTDKPVSCGRLVSFTKRQAHACEPFFAKFICPCMESVLLRSCVRWLCRCMECRQRVAAGHTSDVAPSPVTAVADRPDIVSLDSVLRSLNAHLSEVSSPLPNSSLRFDSPADVDTSVPPLHIDAVSASPALSARRGSRTFDAGVLLPALPALKRKLNISTSSPLKRLPKPAEASFTGLVVSSVLSPTIAVSDELSIQHPKQAAPKQAAVQSPRNPSRHAAKLRGGMLPCVRSGCA
jgi:hypothetical protein